MTLYLADENTLRHMLGAAWLTIALRIDDAILIIVPNKPKTAKKPGGHSRELLRVTEKKFPL